MDLENFPDELRGVLVGPNIPPTPRECAALTPHWKDCIKLDDRKIFVWLEGMYTSQLDNAWYQCDDKEEKEELRLQILEKRQEWLQFWLKNIYHEQ